jgi:deoxyribodipyrimidine photolyase
MNTVPSAARTDSQTDRVAQQCGQMRGFNPKSDSLHSSGGIPPDGRYVRRWIPELTDVPDRYVHEPWKVEPTG